jgi:hypothetical protein
LFIPANWWKFDKKRALFERQTRSDAPESAVGQSIGSGQGFERGEAAKFGAKLHDSSGQHRADAGQLLKIGGGRGVDVEQLA